MQGKTEAVIFDMDGVLIDSEPLWREAMIIEFTAIGLPFTNEDCKKTTGKRFDEVVLFWFKIHSITHINPKEFENNVINRLIELIKIKGKPINGVIDVLNFLKTQNIKIGLATSSNEKLMHFIVNFLQIRSFFHSINSAEKLQYGKPHPQVYLNCANDLLVNPSNCIVVEDSINGMVAGLAAGMKVFVVPEAINLNNPKWVLANLVCENMLILKAKFKAHFNLF
jgi:HAD superfamily hydrolase (TIGR01509 family)